MPHHLEGVPGTQPGNPFGSEPLDVDREPGRSDEVDADPIVRPAWWRWVAIALIVAMVVAGPFAFALYKLLT